MQNLVQLARLEQLNEQLAALGPPSDESAQADEERTRLQDEIAEVQKSALTGISICDKQGFELIEIEEAIKNDGGCWLKFMKLPAPEAPAEEKGGKKAAPKKGQNVDDLKPTFGKAWVDLTELKKPGANTITQRVALETCAPTMKEA